jgi:hypothetical protein
MTSIDWNMLLKILTETIQVVALVFVMMVLVDVINFWSRGKIAELLKPNHKFRQYIVSSAIGTIPGCVGGFTNVSLYIHGMISFGALAGSMVAASGDEAFVMLAMFPRTAVILFAVLFIIGVFSGLLIDRIVKSANIKTSVNCNEVLIHPGEHSFAHYMKEHVWHHIIKRHLWKTALWTFGALLFVEIGMRYWNFASLSAHYSYLFLILSALIGLIPESGPHLLFVTLYANGLIPFSILLTSSIVQDGHSMLPMLSYSIKDSVLVKAFNICLGLIIGTTLYVLGL